jgi:hypothetical protein
MSGHDEDKLIANNDKLYLNRTNYRCTGTTALYKNIVRILEVVVLW